MNLSPFRIVRNFPALNMFLSVPTKRELFHSILKPIKQETCFLTGTKQFCMPKKCFFIVNTQFYSTTHRRCLTVSQLTFPIRTKPLQIWTWDVIPIPAFPHQIRKHQHCCEVQVGLEVVATFFPLIKSPNMTSWTGHGLL